MNLINIFEYIVPGTKLYCSYVGDYVSFVKIIDNKTGVILVKWNDMSWQTMENDKEFVGIGKISSAYYGRNKFTQVVLDEYTQQND